MAVCRCSHSARWAKRRSLFFQCKRTGKQGGSKRDPDNENSSGVCYFTLLAGRIGIEVLAGIRTGKLLLALGWSRQLGTVAPCKMQMSAARATYEAMRTRR